jgi:hypothetical protein
MKKIICLALITVILLLMGCGSSLSDSDYKIKVSGTSGLEFSGSYMVVKAGGESTSKSVDGTVPAEYSVTGDIVSVSFQKQTDTGTLKVEISKDGKVLKSEDTTAAYGVVAIATQ